MDSSRLLVRLSEIDDSQEFEIWDSESVRYLSDGWEPVPSMDVPQTELPRHRDIEPEIPRRLNPPPVPEQGHLGSEVEILERDLSQMFPSSPVLQQDRQGPDESGEVRRISQHRGE